MPEQLVYNFGRLTALRYGNTNGEWDEGAVARVAQFVLGVPVSHSVDRLNEQLMRVVQPVEEFWDPKNNVADILITDPKGVGKQIGLGLGQWIVRYPSGSIRPMPHNQVVASYLPPAPKETFENELKALLVRHERTKGTNTPDHILMEYMVASLTAYNTAVRKRALALNEKLD